MIMLLEWKDRKARTFAMLGGGVVRGRTPGDIIRAMRSTSFAPCNDEKEFMRDLAERAQFYNGATICTYTKEQFVIDLAYNGFLKEIDELPPCDDDPKPSSIIPFPVQQDCGEEDKE